MREVDLYIRGREAERATSLDWEAKWVRFAAMPHMKRPFSYETLRPGRQLEGPAATPGHKPESVDAVKAEFRKRKRSRQHKQYVEGKLREKPTRIERELLDKKGK